MGYRKDKTLYLVLIRSIIVVAIVGVAALVYASLQDDPTEFAFSLIAFIVSVAALLLTALQSLTIAKQLRATERAAELVRDASEQIELLRKKDGELAREIRKDVAFDQEIIAALEELGVGDSPEHRHKVAAHIARKVGKR